MMDAAPLGQACAYCGGRTYRVVVSYPKGTAVRCIQCRLVRSFPYPSFVYQDNKGYALGYTGRERLFARFAKEFMSFIEEYAPGPRLLEIGCGMGFLLEEAVRRGFAAQGLEINRWEVEMTRARGLNVRAGVLEESSTPSESIDVVCMSHVLEHVQDLRSLLHEVHRVLRPGGVLALSQPHYAAPLPRAATPMVRLAMGAASLALRRADAHPRPRYP
jgi:2-polyprenyl-3-methyl-5-hydroxy-6-metoxy-1,4-benzoquinol methylase